MKINNLYEIHFSPTGGTKDAVEVFGEQWNVPKAVIDLTDMNDEFDNYEFYKEDLCVIGVPSYGGRVPAVAVQRIKEMRGNDTPVIIMTTYGNRAYGDALLELQQVVESVGFCVVAALAVVARHSIVPTIATDRPDAIDRTKLIEMSIKIKVHIERAKGFYSARLAENRTFMEYKGISIKPSNVGKCISCGICANNCPVGAIPLDNPKVTDTQKCISCMRCVKKCPKASRKVSEVKVSALASKIKKECQNRKEIEIFVNKNIDKETFVDERPKEVEINNIENVSEASLDGIEEVVVGQIALEDAKYDSYIDGIPSEKQVESIIIRSERIEPNINNVEETIVEETYNMPDEEAIVEETYNMPDEEAIVEETYNMPVEEPIGEKTPKTFAELQGLFNKNSDNDNQLIKNNNEQHYITREEAHIEPQSVEESTVQRYLTKEEAHIEPQPIGESLVQRYLTREEVHTEPQPVLQSLAQRTLKADGEYVESQFESNNLAQRIQAEKEFNEQFNLAAKEKENNDFNSEAEVEETKDFNAEVIVEETVEVNSELKHLEHLEDIPEEFVLPEPEEITMPEVMKGVSLDDIDNDPYELDEDLLDNEEIDEILDLDEIVPQERPEVENPKDFVLNISEELEDIIDDTEEFVEEIEDEIGVVLEDV